jgi:hypothetical protein
MDYPKFISVDSDSFVGLKIENNQVSFYFPIELENFIKNDKKLALNFLKSLTLKKVDNHSSLHEASFINSFESFIWIINDFLHNGFKLKTIVETKLNQNGKINWTKTLRGTPIILPSNKYFLTNIYSQNHSFEIDELLIIYKNCLSRASKIIGWLFDFYYTDDSLIDVDKSIAFIMSLLNKAFKDNDRIKYVHILKILKLVDESNDSQLLMYGVDEYNQIYEQLLRNLIQNSSINDDYFKPYGLWEVNGKKFKDSKMFPDIIFEDLASNKTIVFDAKFYRPKKELPNGLPPTKDIQKQVIYGKFVKNQYINTHKKDIQVYSAFILPSCNESFFTYYGKAYLEHINALTEEIVVCLKVNLKELINYNAMGVNINKNLLSNLVYINAQN